MEKAKILEKLIKEQGYSLRAFAEKCQIPYTTLYGIMKNGVGRASVDNVICICKYLGITVEELDRMTNSEDVSLKFSYEDVESLIARNGKDFSTRQKLRLIKLLSELDS